MCSAAIKKYTTFYLTSIKLSYLFLVNVRYFRNPRIYYLFFKLFKRNFLLVPELFNNNKWVKDTRNIYQLPLLILLSPKSLNLNSIMTIFQKLFFDYIFASLIKRLWIIVLIFKTSFTIEDRSIKPGMNIQSLSFFEIQKYVVNDRLFNSCTVNFLDFFHLIKNYLLEIILSKVVVFVFSINQSKNIRKLFIRHLINIFVFDHQKQFFISIVILFFLN